MPIGKNSVQIGVVVPQGDKAIREEIERRSAQLGARWSLSAYGLEIWRWWYEQGCPAVNPQDHAMNVASEMAAAKKKNAKGHAEQHPQQAGQRNDRP